MCHTGYVSLEVGPEFPRWGVVVFIRSTLCARRSVRRDIVSTPSAALRSHGSKSTEVRGGDPNDFHSTVI